ncbi:MFS transporter [Streptomyces somaliensis DSM 40738]|uniref:MFS transporter n=1 Tax=Streptomyces somaliensis (strain ATCC 33201 / DSM 40738 / JCM 12659 / KCTC 9044 / NCTC 11332 / NRRL B-12077 / IP 733) TaxID=1134445 RepID=A0AA44DD59_STRE0|nr:MFS transporter [Streptomyces somaliensis]MCQ0022535.1 MFS transporter [Streptomyces somaliensis DSM 40738]NKY14716.1 MFS transporter [Streptomyces somaliensis DSM 40738]
MTAMAKSRTGAPASPAVRPEPPGHPRAVVLTACAGTFLVVLDVSVVNVALPSMRADLHLSATALQWVVNAYSIAFSGFMLLGGRAADLFGRKRMFLLGLAVFTAASAAGGLAGEGWQLLAARVVQGLGAAVLSPATLTIVTGAAPEGPARTRAISTWSAVGAGGGAAGGLVGGLLTDLLGWRWVLLVNVPVGVLVLVAGAVWVRESRTGAGRRLDLPGALLVTTGLAAFAYGVVQTERAGWTEARTLVPLLGGAALLAAFTAVESRTREPLVPLKLFRVRAVSAANAALFVIGSATFASWFFLTVYAQGVLGYGPLEAGLALVPSSVGIVAGAGLAPRLIPRAGARNLAVGGALTTAAGFAWQSLMDADGTYATDLLGPGVVMMTGAGLVLTPLAAMATSGAAPGDAGLVSGLVNTSRTMGGAVGLAVLSTVAASGAAGAATPQALTAGYALAFRTGTGVLLAAAVLMLLWLPRDGTRGKRPRTATPTVPG